MISLLLRLLYKDATAGRSLPGTLSFGLSGATQDASHSQRRRSGMVALNQIEPLEPNAFVELGGSFRGDGLHWPDYPGELTPDQFLRDFGGFTYSITIDGDKRTWS
ncbi:MAG: hypothetical protein ACXWKP_12680, partial [Bradyrhizobium sp.]